MMDPVIFALAIVPSAMTFVAVVIFVAVGSRQPSDPSALLPMIAGLMLLAVSGVIWFYLGAHYAGVIA